jgi:HlyD family secretion protein
VAAAAAFVLLRPLPVQIAEPASDVTIQVFGLGTVEARVTSKVGFQVGATLVEMKVDHGDRVKKGDVLAKLRSDVQEANLAKARARVNQAEASLKQASAQVTRAKAQLFKRHQTNVRRQALVAKGAVSEEVAQDAQADEEIAAADLSVSESQIDVAESALRDARAHEQFERAQLAHYTLTAPYDAVVVARHKELGAVLNSGEALFTLVDPASVWVLAHADEASAGGLRIDQPAEVRLRSLPGQVFRGAVARIDIESDRVSEERRVYVKCRDCPEDFYLGEQAEVLITVTKLDKASLVPQAAVGAFDGVKGMVWTVEGGKFNRRTVTFGHRTLDGRLQITASLPEGAAVVAVPRQGLRIGRAAKPMNRTPR